MKYFEITPESPAYKMCCDVWNCNSVWKKAENDITELLGTFEGLAMNPRRLHMNKVPDKFKSQFCKCDRGWYPARTNSEVNKKYLEIVAKYELYYDGAGDIALILGTAWDRGHESYHPPMNGKYYFETERKIETEKGLVKIPEPEFLRLRADWLEQSKGR
jgi:hypothetical protein